MTSLLLSLPSLAINKCVSDSGKVGYQDMPCPEASQSDVIVVKEQNARVQDNQVQVISVLHQSKVYLVGVPKSWKSRINHSPSGDASTLRVKPYSGSDMTLLMTFIKIDSREFSQTGLLDRVMLETDMKYMFSRDSKLNSHELTPLFLDGKVRLTNYVDPVIASRKKLTKGEYAYVTAGALVSDGLLINITILSNHLGSDNYAKAFAAVHTVNVQSANL
ncbi:hypothetical protein FS418_21235 [Shewanella sp. YLB-09]|uniref:hypothetical protein n=1 Tax=Shewanella sp. YLB-09 TaxID=2601269 RepID=UPI00115F571C|nr:hypothetical protein [Shewanella sp. YLB-09]QFU24118.1 hypothetical protein FS418_21235 [Shewanella sp. YLB-09]